MSIDKTEENIGFRFQEERKRIGLNQAKAGAICGVSDRTVMTWEKGAKIPAGSLYRLSLKGADVQYIITGVSSSITNGGSSNTADAPPAFGPAEDRSPYEVDIEFMGDILEAIEKELKKQRVKMGAWNRGSLAASVCQVACEKSSTIEERNKVAQHYVEWGVKVHRTGHL
ncbi:MAG: hypothetical protein GXP10_01150 [Gammaproteobacteria bacterium]|nr:hypothetical protein [Gammaproteobacteria bacterium]